MDQVGCEQAKPPLNALNEYHGWGALDHIGLQEICTYGIFHPFSSAKDSEEGLYQHVLRMHMPCLLSFLVPRGSCLNRGAWGQMGPQIV